MVFCLYFNVCLFKDFFCFVFILLFYDEVWFFCVYIITNFFFFKNHHFFNDSTVPMSFKPSANATCLESDTLLPPFVFFNLAMQEEALCQVGILQLLWGHPVLFPLLILWITHLEYKDLLVTSSSCWYMLIQIGKVSLYCEEMPPDLLYWRHLKHLPLILPLCFLYWTFHKRHE